MPELAGETFPARSTSLTVTTPLPVTSACNWAEVAAPRVNVAVESVDKIVASVAISAPSRYSIAAPPVASPGTIDADAVRLVFVADNLLVITVPPTGVNTSPVGAAGATVSMMRAAFAPNDPADPGIIRVLLAMLPTVSLMVPPFKTSASTECISRSNDRSPACTV